MIYWKKKTKEELIERVKFVQNEYFELNREKDKEIEKLRHIKKQLEKNLQIYMQKDAKNQLKIEKAIQREMELSYLCDTQPDEELLNILKEESYNGKDNESTSK